MMNTVQPGCTLLLNLTNKIPNSALLSSLDPQALSTSDFLQDYYVIFQISQVLGYSPPVLYQIPECLVP